VSIACVLAIVVAGVALQRLVGTGNSMLSAPLFVLILGAWDGITLAVLTSLLAALLVAADARAHLERRIALTLVLTVVGGTPAGIAIALAVPARVLAIMLALVAIGAVSLAVGLRLAPRRGPVALRRGPSLIVYGSAGVVSGIMTSAVSIGGPPLTAASSALGMPHRVFVATIQPALVAMGAAAAIARVVVGGVPPLPPLAWVGVLLAAVAGLVLGSAASRVVPEKVAWAVTLVLSAAGAVLLLIGA
jgi:uncharacterized protein